MPNAINRYTAACAMQPTPSKPTVVPMKLEGVSETDVKVQNKRAGEWDGVNFGFAKGLGHHLRCHVGWEGGAKEILSWAQQL